jgi:hypothetical protein
MKEDGMNMHVARTEYMQNAYKVPILNPEYTLPLGRIRHRWEDDIKKYLKEM